MGGVIKTDMEESDAVLVGRACAGDGDAFEGLVRRHMRAAYAVALGVMRNPTDAEDVVQDAFIKALEELESCREPDRFAAWLARIVRNRAHSFHRYRRVRRATTLDDAGPLAGASDPAQDTARSRLRDRLSLAAAELSEKQRQVLLLHDLEGWKHREIGELMDMPAGTVRYTLHQARRAMRELLGADSLKED
ncbi:MAG: sigma-70 family RNA polymerase sigma factor [Gemmatimonadota bacterium]